MTHLRLQHAALLAALVAAGAGPDPQPAQPGPTTAPDLPAPPAAAPALLGAGTGTLLREGSYLL
ncbi:MAG: hypothetical protein ACYTAQ_10485, partial [Planctomycetota bacterium]